MAGELAFYSEYLSQMNNRLIFYNVNVKSHLCQKQRSARSKYSVSNIALVIHHWSHFTTIVILLFLFDHSPY